MNDLETQLRLWTPRRPSARLEQRLFPAGLAATAACQPAVADQTLPANPAPSSLRFAFLVPATALLLIACAWLNQRYDLARAQLGNSGPLVAMILSNQSAAAYLPGSFDRQQNHLGNTFEWTNGNGSPSSVPSLSAPKADN